ASSPDQVRERSQVEIVRTCFAGARSTAHVSQAARGRRFRSSWVSCAVDDLETLAGDRHSRARRPSDAFAFPSEVCPVGFTPGAQRRIAFALTGRKLFADFLEGDDGNCQSFDDTQRLACPIGHDAERARLRRQPVLRFERPHQTGSRALLSGKYELRELVRTSLVVVEVEGLVKADKSVTADC